MQDGPARSVPKPIPTRYSLARNAALLFGSRLGTHRCFSRLAGEGGPWRPSDSWYRDPLSQEAGQKTQGRRGPERRRGGKRERDGSVVRGAGEPQHPERGYLLFAGEGVDSDLETPHHLCLLLPDAPERGAGRSGSLREGATHRSDEGDLLDRRSYDRSWCPHSGNVLPRGAPLENGLNHSSLGLCHGCTCAEPYGRRFRFPRLEDSRLRRLDNPSPLFGTDSPSGQTEPPRFLRRAHCTTPARSAGVIDGSSSTSTSERRSRP